MTLSHGERVLGSRRLSWNGVFESPKWHLADRFRPHLTNVPWVFKPSKPAPYSLETPVKVTTRAIAEYQKAPVAQL